MTDQNNTSRESSSDPGGLGLLTCSMATDIELFELLARSVDDHVDPRIMHNVVVPAADLPRFSAFSNARREIIAQEEIFPEKLRKLPALLRHLSFLKADLRRPVYIRPNLSALRGWILQQYLKIEVSRRLDVAAIMHVDSDVAFFRRLAPEDAFDGGRVRFFRVNGRSKNRMQDTWIEESCRILGVAPPEERMVNYIENCLLWSTTVTQAMIEHIQEAHGKPLQDVLFAAKTLSEYYVYGVFADLFPESSNLSAENVSFCNSYWPDQETGAVDFEALRRRLERKHCAIAVQSVHTLSISERARLYERASRELASI